MATMDIASFVVTLCFTFAAAGGSDIRSCEMGVVTTCMFEKGIYDLPYVDVSIRRLKFDRLPTKVDLRNLPQVGEVKIDHDESGGNRGACTYIFNNEQAVTVLVESEQPVVCAAHQPSSRPATTGETTVSDHDRPHTTSEEDRQTSSQQSTRDRTSTLTGTNNLPTSSFSSSKTTERTGTSSPSSETTDNLTQDLPDHFTIIIIVSSCFSIIIIICCIVVCRSRCRHRHHQPSDQMEMGERRFESLPRSTSSSSEETIFHQAKLD